MECTQWVKKRLLIRMQRYGVGSRLRGKDIIERGKDIIEARKDIIEVRKDIREARKDMMGHPL